MRLPCWALLCPLLLLARGTAARDQPSEEKAECPEDVAIAGGNASYTDGLRPGSILTYSCPWGYYPYPAVSRVCQSSGTWTELRSKTGRLVRQPSCRETRCPNQLDFENGAYFPRLSSYTVGSSLSFECFDGYNLRGPAQRTCQINGKWNGTTPICDDGSGNCPNPGIPAGAIKTGIRYRIDEKVKYRCTGELDLIGSEMRVCQESGDWTGTEPSCQYSFSYDFPAEVRDQFDASIANILDVTQPYQPKTESLARRLKIQKNGILHIYILLDASKSVGDKNFALFKKSVEAFIKGLSRFEITVNFGIVTYATEPKTILRVHDDNSSDFVAVLETLKKKTLYTGHRDKSGTNIRAALEAAYHMMSFVRASYRLQKREETWLTIRHAILLLTDGKSNMGGSPKQAIIKINSFLEIDEKRKDFLDIYAFGIGNLVVDREELNDIASKKPGENHVFVMEDPNSLKEAFEEMLEFPDFGDMCGLANESPKATTQEKFPWTVHIKAPYGSDSCLGSLIASKWVLTAAHCFPPSVDWKLFSTAIKSEPERTYSIRNLHVHEGYDSRKKQSEHISEFYEYDIALLEVEELRLSKAARPICLPCTEGTTRALKKPPQTTCDEQERSLLSVSEVPAHFHAATGRKLNVNIKAKEQKDTCNNEITHWPDFINVTDVPGYTAQFLCTEMQGGDVAACKGESGGSLYVNKNNRYIQLGIVSWGVYNPCRNKLFDRNAESPEWKRERPRTGQRPRDFHLNLFKPEIRAWLKQKLAGVVSFLDQWGPWFGKSNPLKGSWAFAKATGVTLPVKKLQRCVSTGEIAQARREQGGVMQSLSLPPPPGSPPPARPSSNCKAELHTSLPFNTTLRLRAESERERERHTRGETDDSRRRERESEAEHRSTPLHPTPCSLKMKDSGSLKMKLISFCIPLLVLSSTPGAVDGTPPEPPARTCDLSQVGIAGGEHVLSKENQTGSKLQYKCPEGTYPYPVSSRTCLRTGRWTAMRSASGKAIANAQCRDVTCPTPVQFEHGHYQPRRQHFYNGSVLTFECYGGYTLQGSANRTCLPNGKWSGQTAICDDGSGHCKNPGTPLGAIKSGTQYRVEDKVTYRCQAGLVMFGSAERECLESKDWSGSEPICRAWYTFDTPEEVASSFISSLSAAIEVADPDKVDETFTKRKIKIEKDGKMNIYIVLDASDSVGEKDFLKAKECVITLIEKIASYDITPRYGVISFATVPNVIISTGDDDSTDASKVIDKLEHFKYEEHGDKLGTNTRDALQEVYNMMILQQHVSQDTFLDIRHVVVLMTDGRANMGGNPIIVVKHIRDLLNVGRKREDYLDIYVFGVGDDISHDEINALASEKNNERHVFYLESIEDLQATFEEIIDDTDAMDMCGMGKESKDEDEVDVLKKNPWMTTLSISRSEGEETCKGALVSEYFVLTAAHCFNVDDDARVMTLKIGGTLYRVETVIFHPQYNINAKKTEGIDEFYDYDIALVKVKSKVKFTPVARPICIPCTEGTTRALRKVHPATTCKDHENELLKAKVGIVPAMFIAQEGKSEPLQRKNVKIKTGDKKHACNEDAKEAPIYKNVVKNVADVVTDRFLCTGGIEPEVDDNTCKGDSGGPLIVPVKKRYIQVAIISWGVYNPCRGNVRQGQTPSYARDFHLNLFQVLPFLRQHLKDELKFLPP
ncbi:complement factor B [Rhinatrema bivittatum]|uniref:complement factor B n=1 Tax=Rhinatrema bivittatum TaxID=194408 RepID=UPI00112AAF06|nr:complement factor B [Rhinatrema bivittatum]